MNNQEMSLHHLGKQSSPCLDDDEGKGVDDREGEGSRLSKS